MNGLILGTLLFAAKALLQSAPVAAGCPAWTGLSDTSRIYGRTLSACDLRHKVVLVIEMDVKEPTNAEAMRNMLIELAPYVSVACHNGGHGMVGWEHYEFKREPLLVFSLFGAKPSFKFAEALKPKDDDQRVALAGYSPNANFAVYSSVTVGGKPKGEGKRPFVYVMGREGEEPIYANACAKKTVAEVRSAVKKELDKKDVPAWKPFLGYVDEPKHFPQVTKAIAAGKPLAALDPVLLKGVASTDPEKANEAQMIYDALHQTCSDLAWRIHLEVIESPHRAAYDMARLHRHWPEMRKRTADYRKRIQSLPDSATLVSMFTKMMEWNDPDFQCKSASEAKKIVAELTKMRKSLEKLKESKSLRIQNGALVLDQDLERLITEIPTRVKQ